MIYLIIRTCKRDEMLALANYASAKFHKICDEVIFFSEVAEYCDLIKNKSVFRKSVDNFIGREPCYVMFEDLRKLQKFNDDDIIIWSDSDIIWNYKPEFDYDWAGIGGYYEIDDKQFIHASGQCQIFKGWLWNKILMTTYVIFKNYIDLAMRRQIADDIFISMLAKHYNPIFKNYNGCEPWLHIKYNWLNELKCLL